ncbi:MAG: SDR family NAD(P)-dependent oxidoreductase [Pseudomonadota bacterium]
MDVLRHVRAHPLLGAPVHSSATVWLAHIDAERVPWLTDHVVDGQVMMPATGFVEVALAAGQSLFGSAFQITDFDIVASLPLPASARMDLRTSVDRETGIVRIESRPSLGGGDWQLHARGCLQSAVEKIEVVTKENIALMNEIGTLELYDRLGEIGLEYGPGFRLVDRVQSGGGRADTALLHPPDAEQFLMDPRSLDASLHALLHLVMAEGAALDPHSLMLPVRFGKLTLIQRGGSVARAALRLHSLNAYGLEASVDLFDPSGHLVATVTELRLRRVPTRARTRGTVEVLTEDLIPINLGLEAHDADDVPWSDTDEPADGKDPGGPAETGACLLIDAGMRRIAWDVLSEMATGHGCLSLAQIDPDAREIAERIVAELESDMALTRTDNGVKLNPCPYPELPDIFEALLHQAPEHGPDIHRTLMLRRSLPRVLAGLPSGSPVLLSRPHRADFWRHGITRLQRAVSDWPASRACRIAVVGAPPEKSLARILEASKLGDVVVCHGNHGSADGEGSTPERAIPQAVDFEGLSAQAPFDLVLAVDSLHGLAEHDLERIVQAIAPSGRLLALEPRPSFEQDLLRAVAPARAQSKPMTSAGVSPPAGLTSLISNAGGRNVTEQTLPALAGPAIILTANGPSTEPHTRPDPRRSIVLDGGLAHLAAALRTRSIEVAEVEFQDDQKSRSSGDETTGFVLAVGSLEDGSPAEALKDLTARVSRLIKGAPGPKQVWLLAGSDVAVSQSIGRAFARVFGNEHPEIDVRLVHADVTKASDMIAGVIASSNTEPEIHLRDGTAYVPRLTPSALPDVTRPTGASEGTLSLQGVHRASIGGLHWGQAARRDPSGDDVEIEVEATGLNFRDVMWAQGLLPPEAVESGYSGPTLGMECSGRVVRVGPESRYRIGDRVIAMSPQAFARHVTVSSRFVFSIPDDLAFEVGAALPVIYATAHYALSGLADISHGERVLIHGGAGGVGFAAIEIARQKDAEIFATAGTPEKREWLRMRGVEHVFDSRSLEFADEIRSATGGDGVDVVLNALAGEGMRRSAELLRPFGRFIELGKQDLLGNTHLGLRSFRRNISYFAVDLDELVQSRPARAQRLLADLGSAISDGTYLPPPIEVFDSDQVVDGFRRLQSSGHIGKVVVRPPADVSVPSSEIKPVGHGAWLIVGGTSGLGLAVAEWLVDRGAPALWLVSRGGQPAPRDADRLIALSARADVTTVAADVADMGQMKVICDAIRGSEYRFEGVLHAAAHYSDQLLTELDADRADAVIRPKAEGARVLDRLCRDIGPEHFVLFSSLTARLGTPGQAAYASANLLLEDVAHDRRKRGLPGIAIAWGPVSDEGYLGRDERLREQLVKQTGGTLLAVQDLLTSFGRIISDRDSGPIVSVASHDWGQLARHLKSVRSPVFRRLDRREPVGLSSSRSIIDEIRASAPAEARKRLTAALVAEAAEILRQPVREVDPLRPMTDLGFDSLMAMDLKLSVEQHLGVALPLVSLGDEMTLADLAGRLLTQLDAASGEAKGEAAVIDHLVSAHVQDKPKPGSAIHTADTARRVHGSQ